MGNCCGSEDSPPQNVPQGKSIERNKSQRLSNWKATGVIALRDGNLKDIPSRIAEVGATARTLDATNNRLTMVCPAVFQLTNLQRLLLGSNSIVELPTSIGLLTNLKVLVLDQNSIAVLPEEIGQCSKVEKLSVAGNALAALPVSLGQLQHLKELNVSGNKLKALVPTLGACTALSSITAVDNYIQAIPEEFGNLSSLVEMNLDSNRIAAVPSAVLQGCVRLATLSLHSNPITVDVLQATPGYSEFDERRRSKFDKKIAAGVSMGPKGLDEGIDRPTQ